MGDGKRIQLENMLGVYLVLAAGGCFSVILVLIEMWHGGENMELMSWLPQERSIHLCNCQYQQV